MQEDAENIIQDSRGVTRMQHFVTGKTLTFQLEGTYTIGEFLALVESAFRSPETPQKIAVLVDRTRSQATTIGPQDVRRVLEYMLSWQDRILCLAYATHSDFHYDLMRKVASMAEFNAAPPVEPFRDIDAANAWIRQQTA
jgi:hypothetical protein